MTMSSAQGSSSSVQPAGAGRPPLLEARNISKYFGAVVALEGVSLEVRAGEINCLLGDNGAGKSTLIKTLSGVHTPDEGTLAVDGGPVKFNAPRDALDAGIATVYQDLSVMPLMSISRNFFLGNEPVKGFGPFKWFDAERAARVAREEMHHIGIDVRDTDQLVGTLSGGERQTLAIARAEYFGARVLILDEPTSALGVKESAIVLRHAISARNRGLGVIFITHNVQHALPIGNSFTILTRGRSGGTYKRGELDANELHRLMGGGSELEELQADLEMLARREARGEDVPTVELGSGAVEGGESVAGNEDPDGSPIGRRPQGGPTTSTWVASLGMTARRIRSRARRTSTAARSGTPSRPGPSTTSEPAAAAKRRSRRWRERRRPTMAGRRTDAWRAARNVSPAPVGSVSPSVAVGR